VIGVVLLAALLLLTLAVFFALRTKTFASEERKDHRAEDLADAIVSQYPDGDAFDAALQKHVAAHTDKYFYTKVAGASFPNADGK
jgi:hypothetical protein